MLDAANNQETTQETLLDVNNIEVIYNHVILVLKGVSLKVPKGGITALLGGNGAGKTTTLKAISGLLASERGEVTKGSIKYRGTSVQHADPAQLVRQGVIQVWKAVIVLSTSPSKKICLPGFTPANQVKVTCSQTWTRFTAISRA